MKGKPEGTSAVATEFSAADVPEVVRPLLAAREGPALKEALLQAVRRLGFDYFVFVRTKRVPEAPEREMTLRAWGSFPDGWAKVYAERNYRLVDPRWPAAQRSPIPHLWARSDFPDTPQLREFFDTAASFGIRSGVCMAINQPSPNYLEAFSVSSGAERIDGERKREIARSIGDLWALGAYGHRLLTTSELAGDEPGSVVRTLTPRELECLGLASRGATSRAIAEQLGISERTVNAHLERAIRKFGAKNRQEAIARGISSGLIAW